MTTALTALGATPAAAVLRDGRTLTMRPARDTDLPEVQAMHARCTPSTLRARYLTDARPGRRLCRSLLRTDVVSLAQSPTGAVVAMANLARSEDDPRSGELAVLVEDAWQHRGLGTAMLRHLVGTGRLVGFDEVVAVVPSRGTWAESALGRLGRPLLQRTPFGEAVVRLELAPHHRALLAPPLDPVRRVAVSRGGPGPVR